MNRVIVEFSNETVEFSKIVLNMNHEIVAKLQRSYQ